MIELPLGFIILGWLGAQAPIAAGSPAPCAVYASATCPQTNATYPQNDPEAQSVLNLPQISCRVVNTAESNLAKALLMTWIGFWGRGFIEGYAVAREEIVRVSEFAVSARLVQSAVETYCSSNPDDMVGDAVIDLLEVILERSD